VNGGPNHHPSATKLKPTRDRPCPEIKSLLDRRYFARIEIAAVTPAKAYSSEMKSMRVLAQPIEKLGLTLGADCVPDTATVGVELSQPQL
jgi:hypothetical protein